MDTRRLKAWLRNRWFFPVAKRCFHRLNSLYTLRNVLQDWRYNIRTEPFLTQFSLAAFNNDPFGTAAELPNRIPYEPSQYSTLQKIISAIQLGPSDQIFDIGCGAGRAICMLARQNVARCVGIEYVPWVAEAARKNVANLRGRRAEVEIRYQDARLADYSNGTTYFFFNPFDEDIIYEVLRRISSTLGANPRPIQVVYYNPIHKQMLVKAGFRHVNTIQVAYGLIGHLDVSFWRYP